jgi:hypothetical protein
MEELFSTLELERVASTPGTAVERRADPGWALALTFFGAYVMIGTGAYCLVIGLAGRLPW